ncbi:hypothetical protein Hanom_Chr13g01243421 [Helianthus anomalus]
MVVEFPYSVCLFLGSFCGVPFFYKDGILSEAKGVGRKVLGIIQNVYYSETNIGGKGFACDGETMGPLAGTRLDQCVLLEKSVIKYLDTTNQRQGSHLPTSIES